ncbi:wobble nucleotide-excising tRNase [Pullulanibacillus pueri]|uniref:Protein CR006 P-loop domain-containing protein n=1 Tax=Pullulanibacillus pueri TaxID=1437324 RepID=A0A8J3ENQ5_9BACL|nr:AAA family ATPase [Pullulanibacillus pueri]MBM7683559.1 wobble nucleotide-excising tRNase [Pullulanibacillus pueri]GGH86818.1 hypothetical protein GCM10007096_35400 [Pullulanibacillus pueri]
MIEKIDIKNFGSFKDYEWKRNVGNDDNSIFKDLNIIYGRNYSGKTTLSRIFQCVEYGEIHDDYLDSEFSFHLNDGTEITHDDLEHIKENITMRVYNTDFVKTNLSWFFNDDGTIQPFTILGEQNVEIEKQLLKLKEKLGSVGDSKGLYFELHKINEDFESKLNKAKETQNKLDKKLKGKAQDIKNTGDIYNKPTYNITSIKRDLDLIRKNGISSFILDKDSKTLNERLLREEAKTTIPKISKIKKNFAEYIEKTNALLTKKIKPSKPITELINDNLLQEWVREGMKHHKGKRDTCGFCGSILNQDLWEKLGAHFDEESDSLRNQITIHLKTIENLRLEITNYITLNKNNFYVQLHDSLDKLVREWEMGVKEFEENLNKQISELKEREKDIFNEKELIKVSLDFNTALNTKIESLNKLIKNNNDKTQNLNSDQEKARKELLMDNVADFYNTIQYDEEINSINRLEGEFQQVKSLSVEKREEIEQVLSEKRDLEIQIQDESRGAELVNTHLTNFFGHEELKLVSEGESPNVKFKIIRDSEEAKNLSEGECSLISFCYFMAQIEDEINADRSKEKLIVYIDDPISSLDGNHIFYMFSLIESIIAKRKKYLQMFISTHNLDFLKYLKRLTKPNGDGSINHFLIERRLRQNDSKSFLGKMPVHLKEYVTEFNYLFNEIYNLYKEVKGDRKQLLKNTYNQFYNIPNNIRKFLECYLFYKYPNTSTPLENLPQMFNGNVPPLLNRVINEYSHLVYLDRGWKPVDVDEMEMCVEIIIKRLEEIDPEQFNSLLDSIGVKPKEEIGV